MKCPIAFMLAIVAFGWSNHVSASVQTINFDDYVARGIVPMANSPGSPVLTAQLSNQYNLLNSDPGVVFSSTAPYVAVVAGSTGFSPNGTGVGGATALGQMSYADPVIITFFLPGTSTPGVTSHVSIQGDTTGLGSSYMATLSAFDVNDVLIGSQTLPDVGSEIWTINAAGIHSVRFFFPGQPAFGGGTGIALDNLEFDDVGPAASAAAAPELTSIVAWGGLASMGLLVAGRRRSMAR